MISTATITPPDGPDTDTNPYAGLEHFLATDGLNIRRALVAKYGLDLGCDLHAEALAWASEHWTKLSSMDNPAGYLYRVATSKGRKYFRWRRHTSVDLPEVPVHDVTSVEPGLPAALASLDERQRSAVVLVHAHDMSYQDAADLLGVSVATIRNDLHRGLRKLRDALGVER